MEVVEEPGGYQQDDGSAICVTTSARVARDFDAPLAGSPLRAGTSDGRVDCHAGRRPNSKAVTTVTAREKARTSGLKRRSGANWIPGTLICSVRRIAKSATPRPRRVVWGNAVERPGEARPALVLDGDDHRDVGVPDVGVDEAAVAGEGVLPEAP